MARQGGRVQLEQSNLRLALNIAKMAKEGFSCAAIEETQQLIKKPHTEVQESKMQGVEFPGYKNVKAAIERHPAMVQENQTDGCLPCQNGTAKNPQTHWRRKGMGAPPPEPAPPSPTMPPAPPGGNEGTPSSEIEGVPPGYVYIHTSLPNSQIFNLDAYAKDCKRNKDFIPDLLTDEATSTG